ncbi:unnamed protein product [Effrenium voratum]|nr:unnamed protein product [Effrenium voratum]
MPKGWLIAVAASYGWYRVANAAFAAFKKPVGFYRRPLRPSNFEDGPDKKGPGRGEWQGDADKFTVNWGDSRPSPGPQGRQGRDLPAWREEEEEEEPYEADVPDVRPRRPPRRRRRQLTRSQEATEGVAQEWVRPKEAWRPPLMRPSSSGRSGGSGSGSSPRKEKSPKAITMDTKLEPPARPVNLEAMAQKGLPLVNLYQLEPDDFYQYLIRELGLERTYAKQIRHWLYEKGAQDFSEISIPMGLRRSLAKLATAGAADWKILAERQSSDGTVKIAYGLPDDNAIESVLMPYQDGRRTACISSQVGCAMGCVFCATGQMGFKRHLTSAEIFEQAARFSARLRQKGLRLSSVVLLGMGEPLANFENVVKAVRRINKELNVGMRHITISTVGLVPQIKKLAEEGLQITLAISLHAANDEERSKLLPVNQRYPVASVMQAAREYYEATSRRVSFEWTLIAGENDTPEKAQELGKLIYVNCPGSHVNLIPLNPTNGYAGGPSQRQAVAKFVDTLRQFGVEATVRVRRGIDIDAGCGQLAERALQEYNSLSLPVEA